jgi:hypothetical protein
MASEWKSEAERNNDKLKAEVRALAAELQGVDTARIPKLWLMGSILAKLDAALDGKIALANGSNNFYRSKRLFKYFPSLAAAKAFQGSLRRALKLAEKGIERREFTALRFDEAKKRIRRLLEYLWRRMPGCDQGQLPELLDDLKGQYDKLYRQVDQTPLPQPLRSLARKKEKENQHV